METTLEKPKTEKQTPVADTVDEIARYEKLLDGDYVRIGTDGKPDKDFRKFFYRIANIFPSFFGLGNESEVNMKFQVQKYWKVDDRNQDSYTIDESKGLKTKKPKMVIGHMLNRQTGRWNCLDGEAEQLVMSRDFEKRFARMTE